MKVQAQPGKSLPHDECHQPPEQPNGNQWEPAMSKRLRYHVAISLDGFIATPDGGYDWLVADPAIDFNALAREFDTAVVGRKTYDVMVAQGQPGMPGVEFVVFSRTLAPVQKRGLRIVADDPARAVAMMKKEKGRDIWLFGGGELFRTLLDAGLVDTVELAVMPILLGAGIPVLPPGASAKLTLSEVKRLPKSGIVFLAYAVEGAAGPVPRIRYIKSRSRNKARGANPKRRAPGTKGRRARR
jgi:dihydrofolate reductase